MRGSVGPAWLGLIAVLAVGLLTGCGAANLKHRGDDALEMFDIGITATQRPYLSGHGCAFGLVSFGAGRYDGEFYGMGGGKFGSMRHFHRDLGLLVWSYDEIGWGEDMDPEDPESLERLHIGPVGYAKYPQRRPPYAFACFHYLHLGYGGVVLNMRYVEMIDFVGGWFGADLCGDDGKATGDWPWRRDNPREKPIHQPKLPF